MSAKPGISRRAMIGGGAVALVAVPPLAFLGLRGTDSPDAIVADYLRRMLPGLGVPDADLLAFSAEYLGRRGRSRRARLTLEPILFVMQNPRFEATLPAAARAAYVRRTRDLLTTFLFSTDFFTVAATRPERTSFVAYADPYAVGCRNPLSEKGLNV